jgi:hypothetical protein
LIPEYDERLEVLGVGISPQYFLQHGVFPLLRAVGTSRAELIKAYRRAQADQAAKQLKEDLEVGGRAPDPALAFS